MNNLVPLPFYTPLYYYVILFVILVTLVHTRNSEIDSTGNKFFLKTSGFLLLLFVWLYMGLRPISGIYFGDMSMYNHDFQVYAMNAGIDIRKSIGNGDLLFQIFMKFCARNMSNDFFFFVCAGIYVLPLYFACKKWFKRYRYYAFLGLVASFSFWGYGTNGIRNGIATSLALLALSRNGKLWAIAIFMLAAGIHKTVALPLAGYILSLFIKNPKFYLSFWILAIPVSLTLGSVSEVFFGAFISDSRSDYLTQGNFLNSADQFSHTGFRWDFLLYSLVPIVFGMYFIFKKSFKDTVYQRLFNIYLFANAFWVMVIRAAFTNRFAYLSWFMMAIVIFYPYLKMNITRRTHRTIGIVLFCYFAFTFFMNVIIAGD